MENQTEQTIELLSTEEAHAVFGNRDANIRRIREVFGVEVVARDSFIKFTGSYPGVEGAAGLVREALEEMRASSGYSSRRLGELLDGKLDQMDTQEGDSGGSVGKVKPRTDGQKAYVKDIESSHITFCIGPAGTGKTFLAVAAAVQHLKQGLVRKIVLVRPAVEAGEKLGFLPGDFQAKINPYLRPLYDSLYFLLDVDTVRRYIDRDTIEICPLAYMRGRTLNDAFIILDEAQNTTSGQMLMFLTRMGEGSKIVVTGDVTQIDIARPSESGLLKARRLLQGVKGIAFSQMSKKDVVRHHIVQDIIKAYEDGPGKKKKKGK
jgi:phosphate starvation-inducible PhoH-like protein